MTKPITKHPGMYRRIISLVYLLIISKLLFAQPLNEAHFQQPPLHYHTYTNYRWLNGNITKEGIRSDLEEIKAKGMQGIMFFNISGPYPKGNVIFMSQEWQQLFAFMVDECARLGLKFSFHHCDGWGASGGPWVQKEDAMKRVVTSKLTLEGGKTIATELPQPHTKLDFYRDISVFAFPAIDTSAHLFTPGNVKIHFGGWQIDPHYLIDGEPHTITMFGYKAGDLHVIDFELNHTFPVSAVNVCHGQREHPVGPLECELLYSNDSLHFTSIGTFAMNDIRGGFSFKPVEAKYFRLQINKWTEPARNGNWAFISEIELLSPDNISILPKLEDFEIKSCTWSRRRNFKANQTFPEEQIIKHDDILDITAHCTNGSLKWDAPPGLWTIVRIGYTLTGRQNGPATEEGTGLECDKFNVESVRKFYDGYAKKMLDLVGKHKENTIEFVHGDSFEAEGQNWTQNFSEEFRKYRGYDIGKWLLVLSGEIVESVQKTDAFLTDLRLTISDLMAHNYYATLTNLAHENGVHFRAQVAGEQQLAINPGYYGAMVDQIDTEFWVNHTDSGSFFKFNGQTLDAISTAHIYGQQVLGSESFTCMIGDYRTSPQLLKPIGDKAFAWGLNDFEFHAYIHQPDETYPGWQHFPWGIAFNRKVTWWNQSIPWQNYLNRCNYLLQQGQAVVDFLVFTGEDIPSSLDYTYPFDDPHDIIPSGYKLNAVGRYTLLHDITMKDGYLTAPSGLQYKMLILPENSRMSPEVLRKIEEFVEQGALVYGMPPIGTPGLTHNNTDIEPVVDKLWHKGQTMVAYGKGKVISGISLDEAIVQLGFEKDFSCAGNTPDADILFFHKKTEDGADIYFLTNQSDKHQKLTCNFRVQNKVPELWDALDGSRHTAEAYSFDGHNTRLPVELSPKGSIFVVFRETGVPAPKPTTPKRTSRYLEVNGPWKATFASKEYGTPEEVVFQNLTSWSEHHNDAVKYYSGTVSFTNDILIKKSFLAARQTVFLEIEKVYLLAEVLINGQSAGIIWTPPYRLDITGMLRPGTNHIEIRATNTWANRLIGDAVKDEKYTHMPCFGSGDAKGRCSTFYNSKSKLPDSGISGKIFIYNRPQALGSDDY